MKNKIIDLHIDVNGYMSDSELEDVGSAGGLMFLENDDNPNILHPMTLSDSESCEANVNYVEFYGLTKDEFKKLHPLHEDEIERLEKSGKIVIFSIDPYTMQ